MSVGLALDIAKVVAAVAVAGITGYQTTGTVDGAVTAALAALGGLFAPQPRRLMGKK